MKIKEEHFNHMQNSILNNFPIEKANAYYNEIINGTKGKDKQKLFRWNIMYISIPSRWVCDNLYPYMNDDHIDTALKKIVKTNYNL